MKNLTRIFAFCFVLACGFSQAASPANSSTIILDSANSRVWNVNADTDTVTAIDSSALTKSFEANVGKHPRTLALAPDGKIWVANQDDATISVLSGTDGSLQSTISLPRASMPYGIAFAPDGSAAFVTLQASGRVVKVDATTRAVLGSVDVGPQPRGIAITADSARVLVTRFISPQNQGEVIEVDPAAMTVTRTFALAIDPGPDSSISGRGIPNYISSITIAPNGVRAWIPSKKDNIQRGLVRDGQQLTFETSVRTIVSQVDLNTNAEVLSARFDFDNSDMADAVCFDSSGAYAFCALQGSNRVTILDVANKLPVFNILNTGLAPQGVALDSTAKRLFVQNFMSRTVSVYDVSNIISSGAGPVTQQANISAITTETLAADVLLGKQIFYNASDTRMSKDGYISCASCHVDGGQDGRVWDFTQRGEGLRNSIILQGRAGVGMGRVHWTGNFDEIQDFENDIRNAFGGTGFMSDADFNSGTHSQPLGDPKAGLSANLDALSAYVTSLTKVNKSPFRDYSDINNPAGTLTADAQAGKLIFNSLNCVVCHSGNLFTDSNNAQLHDVGTIKSTSGKRLNQPLTGFDTPTLKGLWETAPYLHDGSAATLLDVITTQNAAGKHGDTLSLTPTQQQQLVAYLQQIDEDEPGNFAPQILITSPKDNSAFPLNANIDFTANATDNGTISKVEYFADGNSIGVSTTAPYSFTWVNVPAGVYAITAVATDDLGAHTTSAPITIKVPALAFASAPLAFPNPASATYPVQFFSAGNQSGVTWFWDFGDGSTTSTTNTVTEHTYAESGYYAVTLQGMLSDGQLVTTNFNLLVTLPDVDHDGLIDQFDTDSDNDGVSDAVEMMDGTDPLNANSVLIKTLQIDKFKAGVNFIPGGSDTCTFSGKLPNVRTDFAPAGAPLLLDVGGNVFAFTLDGKGKGWLPQGKIQLQLKASKTMDVSGRTVSIKAALHSTNFKDKWQDDGLISANTSASAQLAIDLRVAGRVYQKTVAGTYTAKAGKSGKFAP